MVWRQLGGGGGGFVRRSRCLPCRDTTLETLKMPPYSTLFITIAYMMWFSASFTCCYISLFIFWLFTKLPFLPNNAFICLQFFHAILEVATYFQPSLSGGITEKIGESWRDHNHSFSSISQIGSNVFCLTTPLKNTHKIQAKVIVQNHHIGFL